MTLCGDFLILYTSENVLNVYRVCVGGANSKQGSAKLELVRRVSLKGIVARVSRVRSISLFNPFQGGKLNTYLHIHTYMFTDFFLCV